MNRTPVRYKGYIIIYNGPKNYDVLMPDEGYKFVGNYISLGEAKRNIDIRSRIDNPVKLRKLPGRERYRVYEGGKIRAKSTTKKKAKAQVKFLRGLSHGMKPRKNAPLEVYQDVVEIVARKGPGHKCDAKCKRANHTYRHKFSQKHHVTIFGNSDGSLTIRSVLK